MSKFLKLIVNLMILCIAVVALALLVPPLAGVKTVMIDDSGRETNLPLGSVTYGRYVESGALEEGDKILVENGASAYEYVVRGMDETAGTYILADSYNDDAEEHTAELRGQIAVTLFTVPYLAYAAMALQSIEGLIIAGLLIVFMIILFILSELWKKDDEEDEEEEEDDEEERPMTRKEKKRAKKEAKRAKKEAKREAKEAKKRAKYGYEEDDYEDDYEESESAEEQDEFVEEVEDIEDIVAENIEIPEIMDEEPGEEQKEADPMELAMKESMAAVALGVAETMNGTGDAAAEETKELPNVKEAVEEPVQEEVQKEIVRKQDDMEIIAMREQILPSMTASELISKATVNGEEPEIIEDEDAGVTLLDYSKLI